MVWYAVAGHFRFQFMHMWLNQSMFPIYLFPCVQLRREVQSHEKTKKALQERDNIINQLKRGKYLHYQNVPLY